MRERIETLMNIKGKQSVESMHKRLGKIMWDKCGMARNEAGLTELLERIPALREEFWENVNVLGDRAEEQRQVRPGL